MKRMVGAVLLGVEVNQQRFGHLEEAWPLPACWHDVTWIVHHAAVRGRPQLPAAWGPDRGPTMLGCACFVFSPR
jgi:hypothetical protein